MTVADLAGTNTQPVPRRRKSVKRRPRQSTRRIPANPQSTDRRRRQLHLQYVDLATILAAVRPVLAKQRARPGATPRATAATGPAIRTELRHEQGAVIAASFPHRRTAHQPTTTRLAAHLPPPLRRPGHARHRSRRRRRTKRGLRRCRRSPRWRRPHPSNHPNQDKNHWSKTSPAHNARRSTPSRPSSPTPASSTTNSSRPPCVKAYGVDSGQRARPRARHQS